MSSDSFCSKVLLFGEYSIILDSMALAIPYDLFEGKLIFNRDKGTDSELKAFSQFMKRQIKDGNFPWDFDANAFEFDIEQGLKFESTIPQGYGVGSSGALCSAVLKRYGNDIPQNTTDLKNVFSKMESHFHGASSGVDPLISYYNKSLLIQKEGNLGPVDIPSYTDGEGAIFLLNTGRTRRTEPLVNLFLEKCKSDDFAGLCRNVLLPITNGCITSFLEADKSALYESFRQLSDFQYRHFRPMIPGLYADLWKAGLESESYYLKLCGAGGGGFLLGMAKNFKEAQKLLSSEQIRSLYRL